MRLKRDHSRPVSGGVTLHHRRARFFLIPLLFTGLSHGAEAAGPVQIAFSDKLGATVFANPDGVGAWCGENVSLSLLLKDGSPLIGAGLADFVGRVGGMLGPKCPDVKRARVAVYRESDRKLISGPYTIAKAENWAVPVDAPKPAPKAEPPVEIAAAPVAPQPAVAPAPAPAPADVYTQPDINPYNAVLVAKVAENPALLDDNGVQRYWARLRMPGEFNPVETQEFKVGAVLAKARSDLQEQAAHAVPGKVTLLVNAQIGAYDFQRAAFPISAVGNLLSYGRPVWTAVPMNALGGSVQFTIPELPALAKLPMDQKEAEAYIARHTARWGGIDRAVAIAIAVSYTPKSETLEYGISKFTAHIDTAWVLDGNKPIYSFNAGQIADLQHELEERQAAERRQKDEQQRAARLAVLMQQRDQNVSFLSRLPADVRLANFLSGVPEVEPGVRLDNLAVARGRALTSQRPVPVRMLVQAGSGGSEHVDTRWPGHLRLTVAQQGASPLERGSWYLVEGTLTLDGPAEELKPAELTAKTIFACKQDMCADAQDPGAVMDHKLAALGRL